MNIVEKISSMIGVGPSVLPPSVPSSYFPLPFSKYITVLNDTNIDSNKYDYIQDVIDDISPVLRENSIRIVQLLTSKNEKKIRGAYSISELSLPQINFVISRSLVHFSTDTYSNEVAGCLGVKSISAIGNRYCSNFKPFYNSSAIMISGLKDAGESPSFSANESPKIINRIKPESISKAILSCLGLSANIPDTTFIGERYADKVRCDLIPNFVPNAPLDASIDFVLIRMDLWRDEKNAAAFLSNAAAAVQINHRSPSPMFLKTFRDRIPEIVFSIDKYTDIAEVAKVFESGFNPTIICEKEYSVSDKNALLLKFIDYNVNFMTYPKFDEPEGDILKSRKHFLSNGRAFPTLYHLEIGETSSIMNKYHKGKLRKEDAQFCTIRKSQNE
jgi:hypothetical protein